MKIKSNTTNVHYFVRNKIGILNSVTVRCYLLLCSKTKLC